MKQRPLFIMIALLLATVLMPFFLTSVHAQTCPSPCSLITNTNIPQSDATVITTATGYPSPQTLSHTYTFGNGTVNWVRLGSTNITGSSGARYIFKQWSLGSIAQWDTNPNMTTPVMLQNYTATAIFQKLLPLTLTFASPTGLPVSPPTSVTLTSSAGTATLTYANSTSNQYTSHWMDAAIWTVTTVTWQGVQEVLGTQTIDLTTSPTNAQVVVQAYDAKMLLVDNSNHPVSGATVTVTLVNGTRTYTFTSDAQGYVNLGLLPPGTYNAHVTYQNQDYGSYLVDPAINPTDTVTVNSGGTGPIAPLVSSAVLLIIFGLALFLIILAIRVRKPPPPPMIG